jgi:hypothetical protein
MDRNSAHTPGPWHVGAHVNDPCSAKGSYYPIETTQGETNGYVARVYMAGKATAGAAYGDAALIAAAPMLLEAARAVLADLRGWSGAVRRSHGHHSQQSAACDARIHALRSAIAAAEGRQS